MVFVHSQQHLKLLVCNRMRKLQKSLACRFRPCGCSSSSALLRHVVVISEEDLNTSTRQDTVDVEGTAENLVKGNSCYASYSQTPFGSSSGLDTSNLQALPSYQSTPVGDIPAVHFGSSNRIVASELNSHADSNESLADFEAAFCSAKNNTEQDQSQMTSGSEDMMSEELADSTAGEAPSGPIAELAPETMTPVKRSESVRKKPPNVLVYTGKKDSSRQFESVKSVLQHCLNCDRYAIYQLKHEHVLNTPWAQNTVLLVLSSEKAYDGADQEFIKFFENGGHVISFGCAADCLLVNRRQIGTAPGIVLLTYKQHNAVSLISTRYEFASIESILPDVQMRVLAVRTGSDVPLILEASHDLSGGVAVLTQVNMDLDPVEMAISPDIFAELKQSNPARFEILKDLMSSLGFDCSSAENANITPAVLFSLHEEQKQNFLKSIEPRLDESGFARSRNFTLQFTKDTADIEQPINLNTMPILVNHESDTTLYQFNWTNYKQHLKTKILGQTVIYADVMNSTMHAFDSLMLSIPKEVGVVAIARRQTGGKGRGGNVWLSPIGCAMCSVHLRIPIQSQLGQRPAFVQHIAGLAVVEALTSEIGYENINVALKWPNDIWFGDKMKLGGVLVQSTIMQQTLHANVGIGFNVSNKNPTICINDLIEQHNGQHKTKLHKVTVEEMLARTVTRLETFIEEFQEQGPKTFLDRYYAKWLHSDAVVKVERNDNMTVKILGLDNHGYLLAEKDDGTSVSLQDDGNSFDMMANLIRIKTN